VTLETEAASLALPNLTAQHVEELRRIDAELDAAIAKGDPDAYMMANYRFHFTLYRASNRPTLIQLIETVWLQFGPFMRVVYGRLGNAHLHDNHQGAIKAIVVKDEAALRAAIEHDISDGMALIKRTGLAVEGGVAP
jgi:DNA-binding GntR family transcriptional regulator